MKINLYVLSVAAALVFAAAVNGEREPTRRLQPPPCDFPAIYNFGDSNSDTGAISAAFYPIPSPYGETFFQKPAGRSSDGRLLIDFIAEHLGLTYLSAYLDSIGTDYKQGANFATGGSTIRSRQNESIFDNGISPFSLDIQTLQFNQFRSRTQQLHTQSNSTLALSRLPRPKDFSTALYTIDIGQNDLATAFRKLSESQLMAEIPDMVQQLADAVINLYQHGARAFWIHNTGPIGCLPLATFYLSNPGPGYLDHLGCIRGQNDVAVEFNRQLQARVRQLRVELPRAAVTYVDVYTAKYRLISNAKNEGFWEPLKICCGIHENNIHVWCGQRQVVDGREVFGGTCATPSAYVNWDGLHYSQAANQWVANQILNGSLSDPPIPITHACHKHY